ncbi:MAG: phenylalanine--tRNA ligase subunit beta [Cyclobacteriaceae bacterium]|nr:phenylalanine--tRNA ligase subunit beta [Cyclobacteriaceae bacterium]
MRISFSWLKEYIDINQEPEEIAEILTATGLEVEKTAVFETITGGLKGLVVGEVLACNQHPNADKLSVTQVDIGNGETVPIVCGAPNVAAGQKVVVAKVGTTIYPLDHAPFQIGKAKIRGEVSMGMICAEDEIGLGDNHDGIMVLDTDLPNGTPATVHFNISDDIVFEIGLTPNRGDATSHIGVARDLHAVTGHPVRWPDQGKFSVDNQNLDIDVIVENQEACPRYSGLTISGITVGESPQWIKDKLLAIGLNPINNVVDITNFVLHEMGQPLHAFDADEVTGNQVIVKSLPDGATFTTLDEVERKLKAHDLMICNESEGMCIAGVFGGIKSGVKESTKNIFLESAYFSPDYIRRTAQHHGLKTDASFRFERGTDPDITVTALKRAAMLIKEVAGGQISSAVKDIYPEKIPSRKVAMKYAHIDRLIGEKIDRKIIERILTRLDVKVENNTATDFTAVVPAYRSDVTREADVIEEILRIYGFNNIPVPEHTSSDFMAKFPEKDPDKVQQAVTSALVANGFYEIITNSLTKPEYAEKDGLLNPQGNVKIINKLSEDLEVMRQRLLYTMMEVAAYNISHKQRDLKLFEIGKVYFKTGKGYGEQKQLGILMTGHADPGNWHSKSAPATFFHLSSVVRSVIEKITPRPIESRVVTTEGPWENKLELQINNKVVAVLGKVKRETSLLLEIKQEVYYAELFWDYLSELSASEITYQEVPKFPEVKRDLSLVLDKARSYEEVKNMALKSSQGLLKRMDVFDVYEGDKIEQNKKAYAITFILQDKEKTLTDKVIDKTMAKLMRSFETQMNALIRK